MPSDLPVDFSATRYLDLQRARDMLGDEARVRDIVELAHTVMQADMPRMRQSVAAGDIVAAGRVLHSLKGMVPVFCKDELVEHVTSSERLSKTGQVHEFMPAYLQAEQALEALLAEIGGYLGLAPRTS